jgi:hypothetical protein
MLRRNWLQLFRKIVDSYDMDYTVSALAAALSEQAIAFYGEGVLITGLYPTPFPITLSGGAMTGTVGSGLAFDPNGQITRIDPGSSTSKTFTIPASDVTNPRLDLLVIRYVQTGDTPIPEPSDPLTTINLNLHDDFVLAIIEGTPGITPAYPAKGACDIILAGIQVPANAANAAACTLDLNQRELAYVDTPKLPVFNQEVPTGVVDGTNAAFTLSAAPMNAGSLLIFLDSLLLSESEYSRIGNVVTLSAVPAIGQVVTAWYFVASPSSVNPLSGAQEVPTGAVDGTNLTYALAGKPADARSTLVFLDGRLLPNTDWSLVISPTTNQIVLAGAPAVGQTIYVFYLVNPATVGTGAGAGGGGLVVYGNTVTPILVTPSVGIVAPLDPRALIMVRSTPSGGGQNVTANPQISAGSRIGQELYLDGKSTAGDYPILADGNGLSLNGPMPLSLGNKIILYWNGTVWDEVSRRT